MLILQKLYESCEEQWNMVGGLTAVLLSKGSIAAAPCSVFRHTLGEGEEAHTTGRLPLEAI